MHNPPTRWLERLEEEFFLQGDKERDAGLPISPLFDRTKQGVSKSQVGGRDVLHDFGAGGNQGGVLGLRQALTGDGGDACSACQGPAPTMMAEHSDLMGSRVCAVVSYRYRLHSSSSSSAQVRGLPSAAATCE